MKGIPQYSIGKCI